MGCFPLRYRPVKGRVTRYQQRSVKSRVEEIFLRYVLALTLLPLQLPAPWTPHCPHQWRSEVFGAQSQWPPLTNLMNFIIIYWISFYFAQQSKIWRPQRINSFLSFKIFTARGSRTTLPWPALLLPALSSKCINKDKILATAQLPVNGMMIKYDTSEVPQNFPEDWVSKPKFKFGLYWTKSMNANKCEATSNHIIYYNRVGEGQNASADQLYPQSSSLCEQTVRWT